MAKIWEMLVRSWVDVDKAAACDRNNGFVGSDFLGSALWSAYHYPNQGRTKATQPPIT